MIEKVQKLIKSNNMDEIWEYLSVLILEYNKSLEDFAFSAHTYDLKRSTTYINTKSKKRNKETVMSDKDIDHYSKCIALKWNNVEEHRGYKNILGKSIDLLQQRINYLMHMNNRDI